MPRFSPPFVCLLAALLTTSAAPALASEPTKEGTAKAVREFLKENPDVLEQAIRDALARNPKLVGDAFASFLMDARRQGSARTASASAPREVTPAVLEALMRSPRQVSFGPANAKRVLVEFMDYNCGFCRRAHEDKFRLLAADAELRVIVRELPVLGPGSVEAAQVASALRMQDTGGALYARFHGQMMQLSGPASRATALQTAREAGADMIRLEADLASPEVAATIEESRDLARQLGISGTPSYIAEGRLIVGAVGPDILRKALQKLD